MHAAPVLPAIDMVAIKRALISVSDKTGVAEFAAALQKEYGVELISTGGTAKVLREAGLKVADISEVTGFPEMMDGRVKTLHPLVHGGFLALRDKADHVEAMAKHGIKPIDLVVVNLYPFEETIARQDATFADAIENIDIGGPAMIRSAAKNHRSVCVVTDPFQYDKILKAMHKNGGQTPYVLRLDLAMWAYTRTAQYDAAIYPYLARHYFAMKAEAAHAEGATSKRAVLEPVTAAVPYHAAGAASTTPADVADYKSEQAGLLPVLTPRLRMIQPLRYGENPHQLGAFYADAAKEPGVATLRQLHGIPLSYINILDADAALELVREFTQPAAGVIKHATPCGCAIAETLATAFDLAYAGDPVAAFGGIVALNRPVEMATAEMIVAGKRYLDIIIAPSYAPAALALLKERWKNCRILETGALPGQQERQPSLHYRSVTGGMLVQQRDMLGFERKAFKVASNREPTEAEWRDLEFVWLATKHVKSNAIALAKGGQLLAAGAGQMKRNTSARLAIELAKECGHSEKLAGCAAGSDAYFPFADGAELLIAAGVSAIIQPGGSKKDQDTIDVCNAKKVALVLTGQRHFRH